jgi:hypothetical protein
LGGGGSKAITIASAEDLEKISKEDPDFPLNGNYIQTADIDMNDLPNWVPIGPSQGLFTGTYNGGGYSIKNLYINGGNFQGLFGYINGGSVRNVALVNCAIYGADYVGGIAGALNGGTVENCYVTGNINGNHAVGGIVGDIGDDSTIINCYSTADVTGGSSHIGGIAGSADDSTIKNCVALNPGIIVAGSVGRIGVIANSEFSNNYARSDLDNAAYTNKTDTGKDGADVSPESAVTQTWWTSAMSAWEWFDPPQGEIWNMPYLSEQGAILPTLKIMREDHYPTLPE